jgi:hypothetical protein
MGVNMGSPAQAPQTDDNNGGNKKPTNEDAAHQGRPNVLGIPLRGWAIFAVSIIFVVYVAAHFSIKLIAEARDQNIVLANAKAKLEKQHAAESAISGVRVSEWERHATETGETLPVHLTKNGAVAKVTYYPSDKCIRVQRDTAASGGYGISMGQDLWIPDPSKLVAQQQERPSYTLGTNSSAVVETTNRSSLQSVRLIGGKSNAQLIRTQGACMNPHPWGFTLSWGAPNGCLVPLYRTWRDGCQHFQWYNSCTGYWDPAINWVHCSGQHFP